MYPYVQTLRKQDNIVKTLPISFGRPSSGEDQEMESLEDNKSSVAQPKHVVAQNGKSHLDLYRVEVLKS